MRHKVLWITSIIALGALCVFHMSKKPFDPLRHTAAVIIQGEYFQARFMDRLGVENACLGQAACIDAQRRYFVMGGTHLRLLSYDKITLVFGDGSRSLATLVLCDPESGMAIIQAERIPSTLQALTPSTVSNTDQVDGYHMMLEEGGPSHIKITTSFPRKTLYEFGYWSWSHGSDDVIFIDPETHNLLGIHILRYKDSRYFVTGSHIAYVLSLLQRDGCVVFHKPRYEVCGVATAQLAGAYSKKVDKELSAPGDQRYAQEVFMVVQGDGVFQPGDILKYRHVDQQGDRVRWGGPNKRTDTSNKVKVLRGGQVIDLVSQAYPVDREESLVAHGIIFYKFGFFLRYIWGGAHRDLWCYRPLRPFHKVVRVVDDLPQSVFDRVNGRAVRDVGALRELLQTKGPIVLSLCDVSWPSMYLQMLEQPFPMHYHRVPASLEVA